MKAQFPTDLSTALLFDKFENKTSPLWSSLNLSPHTHYSSAVLFSNLSNNRAVDTSLGNWTHEPPASENQLS